MIAGPWVVVASFTAAAGTAYLIAQLWTYRRKPGASWFLASLGCQALASLANGVALLTFDRTLRLALEACIWASLAGLALFFFLFALGYTGRTQLLDPWWTRAVLAVPLVVAVVGVTNPLHSLAWTGFAIDPVGGLAAASYRIRPWLLVASTVVVALPVVGSLLLFDTVFSYGPLYRGEAVAVGLSTLPPVVGVLAWLYGLGPVPELNFLFVGLIPHVVLDGYAFVRSDMFEFHPATRRAGERAAIDDLGNPVVIVDERGRVVTLNPAAESVLGADKRAALGRALDDLLDPDGFDPTAGQSRVAVPGAGVTRTFNVTATPLRDGTDTHVGYTVVFQDVTDEIHRERRLEVLNRVLRHNLRNDMTVVRGLAETVRRETDDGATAETLDTVVRKADELVELSEKARAVERTVAREPQVRPVELAAVVADVVARVDEANADVTIAVACPEATVETDAETLGIVLEALVENAVEHGADADGTVEVRGSEREGSVTIAVADDGPGIPEQELDVLDAGTETDLEHSTGLGLWLAVWGSRQIGGEITFDVSDDGTVARLTIPGVDGVADGGQHA